ncbi:MAG: hypothetical protein PHD58_11005 [Anaerolineales bacterium]|nr:hypothetical protein [Anaerolineales bacterium]
MDKIRAGKRPRWSQALLLVCTLALAGSAGCSQVALPRQAMESLRSTPHTPAWEASLTPPSPSEPGSYSSPQGETPTLLNSPQATVSGAYPAPGTAATTLGDPYPSPAGWPGPATTTLAPLNTEVQVTSQPTEPPIVFTALRASDPTRVSLAAGKPQLVEVFAFW